jgi:hypothetical protein
MTIPIAWYWGESFTIFTLHEMYCNVDDQKVSRQWPVNNIQSRIWRQQWNYKYYCSLLSSNQSGRFRWIPCTRPLLGNRSVPVFRVVRAEKLFWRPSALTVQFLSECSEIQISCQLVVGSLLSELKPGVRRNTRGLPVKLYCVIWSSIWGAWFNETD